MSVSGLSRVPVHEDIRQRGHRPIGESSCHRHRYAATTHLTHNHRPPVQQTLNCHGVQKFHCITTSNRVHVVLLAHLRSGRTLLLKVNANLLDPTADPACPLCKEEPQELELWLQRCPNLDVLRQRPSVSVSPPLGVSTVESGHSHLLKAAINLADFQCFFPTVIL